MNRLRQLRLDRFLTIDALAEESGVPARTIRRLEAGNGARVETLARLSTYFQVPASSLLLPALPPSPTEPEDVAA